MVYRGVMGFAPELVEQFTASQSQVRTNLEAIGDHVLQLELPKEILQRQADAMIAFEKGFVKAQIPRVRTGNKIAVVGSGPAGLAVAAQLNYAGHSVTVFERDDFGRLPKTEPPFPSDPEPKRTGRIRAYAKNKTIMNKHIP